MISRSIDNDTSTYEAPLYLKGIVDANNNKIRILSVHKLLNPTSILFLLSLLYG